MCGDVRYSTYPVPVHAETPASEPDAAPATEEYVPVGALTAAAPEDHEPSALLVAESVEPGVVVQLEKDSIHAVCRQ